MSNLQTSREQMEQAYLEAERVRSDPAIGAALTELRKLALERLACIEPTDIEGIRNEQATVRAIDGLATEIGQAILRWNAAQSGNVRA